MGHADEGFGREYILSVDSAGFDVWIFVFVSKNLVVNETISSQISSFNLKDRNQKQTLLYFPHQKIK